MRLSLIVLLATTSLAALAAQAGPYSVSGYQITGGGVISTGVAFTVTGSISQPEASVVMTGHKYTVTGGYGSLVSVVQSPGAPVLTITRMGNSVKISWPYPATGWTLQQAAASTAGNWTADNGVSSDSTNNYIILTAPAGNLFFRLSHP
jgi:hypothetical protein